MADLNAALENIRRAAAAQCDPKRVRLNRADFDVLMADYLRMAVAEAASERQTATDVMIYTSVIFAVVPLCVAAGWLLRA